MNKAKRWGNFVHFDEGMTFPLPCPDVTNRLIYGPRDDKDLRMAAAIISAYAAIIMAPVKKRQRVLGQLRKALAESGHVCGYETACDSECVKRAYAVEKQPESVHLHDRRDLGPGRRAVCVICGDGDRVHSEPELSDG